MKKYTTKQLLNALQTIRAQQIKGETQRIGNLIQCELERRNQL